MPIEILTPRHRVQCEEFRLNFPSKTVPGAGWAPPCDKDGNLIDDEYGTKEHYAKAAEETRASGDYGEPYVQAFRWSYVEPATAKCTCGGIVSLGDALDNECEACGKWYNMCGQNVIPSHLCDDEGNPTPSYGEEY